MRGNLRANLGITTLTEKIPMHIPASSAGLNMGRRRGIDKCIPLDPEQGKIQSGLHDRPIWKIPKETSSTSIADAEPVYSEQTAYLMTDMMRTVITSGTATDLMRTFEHYGQLLLQAKPDRPSKTGTPGLSAFTPDIIVGVWAGYDRDHTLTLRSSLPQGPGTQRAKNIWSEIMDTAMTLNRNGFRTKNLNNLKISCA